MEQEQQIRIGKYTSLFRGKDQIGRGGYGSVYVGYQIGNPKNKVAIKLVNLKKTTLAEVMNEIQCMVNNRSQGTLEILAYDKIKFGLDNQDHYAIVTEKMDGSLRKMLQQKGKLTEEQAAEWGAKIIKCYKYLYEVKIIHRDLKPDNVLYRKFENQVIFKIADFGNSRNQNASRSLTIGKGTNFYISPQQQKQGNYTNKTDVYAFGCMLFEFLVGSEKVPKVVSKVVLSSGKTDSEELEKVLQNLGISKRMIKIIQGCLMYEQSDRLSWKDIFTDPIFQKVTQKIGHNKLKMEEAEQIKVESKINKLRITPDTTTYAWKQKKDYRQDNANKNVCIYQGKDDDYQWLCSSDLCDGECVLITIKVFSPMIQVGLMDSNYKGKQWQDTLNHCVYLNLYSQIIQTPNQEQIGCEGIYCSCQSSLSSVPCLIECQINRTKNNIVWHYNGKEQASSSLPKSWTDGRSLCGIVFLYGVGDSVEFM